MKRFSSKKWRDAARGEMCTLRLACCNRDPSTTVLCHIRRFGWGSTALKPPDYLAVFACHACHDAMDRRSRAPCADTDILRALGETLGRYYEKGMLT